jgi:TctA family transporter
VITCGTQIPRQRTKPFFVPFGFFIRGTLSGVAGGLFASFLPVVSGGVGGLLSGHATAQRDERIFLISQGASKVAYYTGSLLLLFVPGLTLTRGGMSWMLTSIFVPYGWRLYSLAVAVIALGGMMAYGLLFLGTHYAARIVPKLNVRWIAACALVAACVVTLAFAGLAGIITLAVASLIGLIPVFVGGRRMNGLGILLVPMSLNFVGIAPAIAAWLGLV